MTHPVASPAPRLGPVEGRAAPRGPARLGQACPPPRRGPGNGCRPHLAAPAPTPAPAWPLLPPALPSPPPAPGVGRAAG